MKKTLALTALILAFPGNLGTKSAQAGITVTQALTMKHNMLVSLHVKQWYHGKGHWTLHERFKTCQKVSKVYSQKRASICYKSRLTLEHHAERYAKIHAILYPEPVYDYGGYNWDAMVNNCEARNAGWYANTGNGFFFGPQFTKQTWHGSEGGPVLEMGDANGKPMKDYSVAYIKHIAYNTMKLQGPGAWPNCHGYL